MRFLRQWPYSCFSATVFVLSTWFHADPGSGKAGPPDVPIAVVRAEAEVRRIAETSWPLIAMEFRVACTGWTASWFAVLPPAAQCDLEAHLGPDWRRDLADAVVAAAIGVSDRDWEPAVRAVYRPDLSDDEIVLRAADQWAAKQQTPERQRQRAALIDELIRALMNRPKSVQA
jgi:hypothetical protein